MEQGTIGLRTYLIDNGNLVEPCDIANFQYHPKDGEDFSVRFNYTDCCP